jgi:hypothetical protein
MVPNQAMLSSRLAKVREEFLSAYGRALVHYRARYSSGAPEVMFQVDDNSRLALRVCRIDWVSAAVSPVATINICVAAPTGFETVRSMMAGVAVTVEAPCVWNGITFISEAFDVASAEFVGWCERWLDVADIHKPDALGLSGVIHSVTSPAIGRDATCELSVDFGSAPVDAFEELVEILGRLGVRNVTARSAHLFE